VDGDDVTIIDILSGAVEAKPHGTGDAIVCVGGQSILIAGPNEDAMCGDLGSFSTAAGSPGRNRDRPEPGHGGQDRNRPEPKKPDRPAPDRDPPDGEDGNEGGGSNVMLLSDEEPFELG
jgi:hypothetical protein